MDEGVAADESAEGDAEPKDSEDASEGTDEDANGKANDNADEANSSEKKDEAVAPTEPATPAETPAEPKDDTATQDETPETPETPETKEDEEALKNATDAKVLKYASVFDAKYYLENNPDIAAAFGNDALAALNHFLKYGINEGRKGNATFNVEGYYNANQDLRNAYGTNLAKYVDHYVNNGEKEGREFSAATITDYRTVYGNDYAAVYDGAYYRKNNTDLDAAFTKTVGTFKLFDDTALLKHFINYGMREGRASTANFEIESYYNANQDLRAAYGTNLAKYYTHYMNYGKKEGRTAKGVTALQNYRTATGGTDYASVYDGAYYRTQNPDLDKAYTKTVSDHILFDDTALLNHFVKYGMREARNSSATFEVLSYYNANPDLRVAYGTDLAKYYTHYVKYGKKEGRSATSHKSGITSWCTVYGGVDYAPVYDARYYWDNNADLSKAFTKTINGYTLIDDAGLIAHFVKYGANEGRLPVSLDKFNVSSYYNEYKDLRHAYGFNLTKYYTHYARIGYKEGRNTTGCTEIKQYDTVYAGIDWARVYDGSYYRNNNADIAKYCTRKAGDFTLYDDQRQIAHFYNYGMTELRKGNATFDPWSYFLEYEDVRDAYNDSSRMTYYHYVRYGYREGRHPNGCTTLHGRHWYTGYQNPSQYYQVTNKSVKLNATGRFGYATPSRISYDASRSEIIETYIARALEYVGTTPYIWDYACNVGVGVDCAGLVMQALYSVGMNFGSTYTPYDHYYTPGHDHYANDMWNDSKFKHVSFSDRQRGDIVCYNGHVAIYLGNNRIVEAANPSVGCRISSVYSSSGIKGCLRPIA